MGAVLAIPTLPVVTRAVDPSNCTVLVVTLPLLVISWKLEAMFSRNDPSPTNRVAYTLPVTCKTLEPVSSTYKLEPTSRSWMGAVLAIPTLSCSFVVPVTVMFSETVKLFWVMRFPKISTVIRLESSNIWLSVNVFCVYPIVNVWSWGSSSPWASPWWMRAIFLPGCSMMIPTSSSWDTLLLAIPIMRSLITRLLDSTVYELPSTMMSPRTSRSDEMTMVPLERPIVEFSRKFPVPTMGILSTVKFPTDMRSPTSMFEVVTRPVVAFVNWTVLEVVFPWSETTWRFTFERSPPSP